MQAGTLLARRMHAGQVLTAMTGSLSWHAQLDFQAQWAALMALLGSGGAGAADMLCRVLVAIDEDIVSLDIPRSPQGVRASMEFKACCGSDLTTLLKRAPRKRRTLSLHADALWSVLLTCNHSCPVRRCSVFSRVAASPHAACQPAGSSFVAGRANHRYWCVECRHAALMTGACVCWGACSGRDARALPGGARRRVVQAGRRLQRGAA